MAIPRRAVPEAYTEFSRTKKWKMSIFKASWFNK